MKFVELDPALVRACLAWDILQAVGSFVKVCPTGPWIGGGAVRRALRNEAPSDVDIFCASTEQAAAVRKLLPEAIMATELASSHRVEFLDHATIKGPVLVQVVLVVVRPTLPEVLTCFDFHEAACGFDGVRILVSAEGLMGLLRGHLSINPECSGQFPGVTARRIVKYTKAGLIPCAGTYLGLLKMAGVPDSVIEVKYVD